MDHLRKKGYQLPYDTPSTIRFILILTMLKCENMCFKIIETIYCIIKYAKIYSYWLTLNDNSLILAIYSNQSVNFFYFIPSLSPLPLSKISPVIFWLAEADCSRRILRDTTVFSEFLRVQNYLSLYTCSMSLLDINMPGLHFLSLHNF